MLDLVGVRFHKTSRSLRSIWEISEKLDVWIISGCFLSQRTLNIWQWASESCICHLSPFTRRRIMVSQKQFRLVARPNSCKRHFVHPNPLQTSLKHPYKPHMILGCTIFFFGDASHIILCCILYHPHLTNKKLTKSRCPVAMHVAKPGDKKKFRIFDSRQQILIIPCRQNLSTWELESREIEREVTKACRWYGHSVVPLHQSLPTQRGTSEPQLTAAATCRNDCKKRNQASWNGS